jgi:hypothetical protein
MPSYMTRAADRNSWRFRNLAPSEMTQHGDLRAALAVLVLLAELAFAQVTLVLTTWLLLAGRLTRWRPHWLAVPAAAGLAWVLAVGAKPAAAGFVATGDQILRLLARHGTLPERFERLRVALADWRTWLPRQIPVALIAAAAQAAVAAQLGQATRRWAYRPGWLVAARNRYLTATLRRGELGTAGGCCLGIIERTGSRAEIFWPEAEGGVLCTGQDPSAVLATGLDLAVGAIQHRKTVIVIDLSGGTMSGAARGSDADPIGFACQDAGAPLRRLGPAQLGELDAQVRSQPGLDRLARDRLVHQRLALGRAGDSHATPPGPVPASLNTALAAREVVHMPLDRRTSGRSVAMIARLALAGLIEILSERSELGGRVDCLVWINGCEALEYRQLAGLLALGERTGTAVVLGTTNGSVAATLVADVNVVAVRGASPVELARPLPDRDDRAHSALADALADFHGPGCREVLSLRVGGPHGRLVAGCKVAR